MSVRVCAVSLEDLSSMLAEQREPEDSLQRFHSGVDVLLFFSFFFSSFRGAGRMGSEGGGGARRGQIKDGILDSHFNYSTEPKWGSRCQLPAAGGGGGGGRGLCSPASRCCISADLFFFFSCFKL